MTVAWSLPVALPQSRSFQGFSVEIDERAVYRLQGYVRPQDKPDQRVRRLYQDALKAARPLIASRGHITFYKIARIIEREAIILADGTDLTGKNIARTFRGADVLAVGLVTIGPALEERVRTLFAENELALALMMDSIGSEAAEGAAIYLDREISHIAETAGWRRTPRMSPGYGSFTISEQQKLFTLLEGHDTHVVLSGSFIMLPQKSVSFIIGCGHSVRYFKNLSPCRVCDVTDCALRDLDSERCLQ